MKFFKGLMWGLLLVIGVWMVIGLTILYVTNYFEPELLDPVYLERVHNYCRINSLQ